VRSYSRLYAPADSRIDAAVQDHIKRHDSAKDLLFRAHVKQPTERDATLDQRTGPYAIVKLSKAFEDTGISDHSSTDLKMPIRYLALPPGTVPPLASETQPQILGTFIPKMRTVSGSAAVCQKRMENSRKDQGNPRPSKRQWEKKSDLATRDDQSKSDFQFSLCLVYTNTF
jgi:hypothetical protein